MLGAGMEVREGLRPRGPAEGQAQREGWGGGGGQWR